MKVIGVTGGIGSGKSTVCKVFETLDVQVFYSDVVAKSAYDHQDIRTQVEAVFGPNIYLDDQINREKLGALVFADPQKLGKLNDIIHPFVGNAFEMFRDVHAEEPYIINEAAILFESGAYKRCDSVIVVAAPEHIRLKRVVERDHAQESAVRERMAHQMSEDQRMEKADWIIRNDGIQALLPQIISIHKALISIDVL